MGDTFQFRDETLEVRLNGTLHDPEATAGDVLTVQSDGSVAAAPGGGATTSQYTFGKSVCIFAETIGAGTYTATVPVVPGGRVLEVVAFVLAGPWYADTAVINAGDTAQPTGYLDASSHWSDLVGGLNTPYDPTADNTASIGVTWLDPSPYSPPIAYTRSADWYGVVYGTNQLTGVPYPSGDNIVVTVVTTGAYDTGPIAASTLGVGGSGYAPGDTGNIDGGSGDAGYVVDTVDGGGAVLTYHVDPVGTRYPIAADIPTDPNTGAGDGLLTINVTAITQGPFGLLVVDVIGFGLSPQTFAAVKS